MLTVGLSIKDSFLRRSGLVVLALLTGKLLFFDLANHNTFERILSFIAAGIIFLLASYLYSRFSGSFEDLNEDLAQDVNAEPAADSEDGSKNYSDISGSVAVN
jgi:uncharacterized membrane protein